METSTSIVRVLNSRVPPRDAIGLLALLWSNGRWHYGSGALLDAQHFLTCAHNLLEFSGTPPPHAVRAQFYPGYNEPIAGSPPPGGRPVRVAFFPRKFAQGIFTWDVAVCRLAERLRSPPPYCFEPTSTNSDILGRQLTFTGYPQEFAGEMAEAAHEVIAVEAATHSVFYARDTWCGHSGSPVWRHDPVEDIVRQHGLHLARDAHGLRRGLLITPKICDWVESARRAPDPRSLSFQLVAR